MKISRRFVPLLALLLAACSDESEGPPVGADTINARDLAGHIERLASDEFEGRKPGTPGGKKTQDYLINSFKSIGLEPGNNGSYMQEVKLLLTKGKSSGVTLIDSSGDSLNWELYDDILPSVEGVENKLSVSNVGLVFVGFGSESEKFNWDDYADVPWWDAIDLIGVQAYFELGSPPTDRIGAATAHLAEAWQPIKQQLASLSRTRRRRVLFTEIGYKSHQGATAPAECRLSQIIEVE